MLFKVFLVVLVQMCTLLVVSGQEVASTDTVTLTVLTTTSLCTIGSTTISGTLSPLVTVSTVEVTSIVTSICTETQCAPSSITISAGSGAPFTVTEVIYTYPSTVVPTQPPTTEAGSTNSAIPSVVVLTMTRTLATGTCPGSSICSPSTGSTPPSTAAFPGTATVVLSSTATDTGVTTASTFVTSGVSIGSTALSSDSPVSSSFLTVLTSNSGTLPSPTTVPSTLTTTSAASGNISTPTQPAAPTYSGVASELGLSTIVMLSIFGIAARILS